jgi:hypothetical protein
MRMKTWLIFYSPEFVSVSNSVVTASVACQSSWLQIRRPGFDSRHYQEKKISGSGTGSIQPREYN